MALGAFAQDQWQLKKLTLNLGLRYEYLNAYAPATNRPAGPLQDAARFQQVDCLPCWHDLYPRMGAVYDLFGNGKTALKASLGRYPTAQLTTLADTFRPITSAVNSTTRAWTDSNGNFFPDCDLRNPALNGECARDGEPDLRSDSDPDHSGSGLDHRVGQAPGYNWTGGVSLDHELRPGVALSGGFYRTLVRQFHGDRQPARDAGRLRSVLRHGADRCALAQQHQRPAALWVLRHQRGQVRSGQQPRHARLEVRQTDRGVQRRRPQREHPAPWWCAGVGRLEHRQHDQPAGRHGVRFLEVEPVLRRRHAARDVSSAKRDQHGRGERLRNRQPYQHRIKATDRTCCRRTSRSPSSTEPAWGSLMLALLTR